MTILSPSRTIEGGNAALIELLVSGLLLPLVLIGWAQSTTVQLRPFGNPAVGAAIAFAGAVLIAMGLVSRRRRGGPVSSAPRLVTTGIYRWIRHPLYFGYSMGVLGVAMAFQSASGLWLVTPAVLLGAAALVIGYEWPTVHRRFGALVPEHRWLPPDTDGPPPGMGRIRCYLYVLLPWVAIYEIIVWSGRPLDAFAIALPGEGNWPIFSWAEPVYASTYVLVGLVPLLASTSRSLRQFMIRSWLAMAIVFPLYLALPIVAPLKPFEPSGFWGHALGLERLADPPLAAFPSFHAIWAFLTAELIASRGRKSAWIARIWAFAVAVSCVGTGQHWTADVVAAWLLCYALVRGDSIWNALHSAAERFAASRRQWRFGPTRVFSHGVFAGISTGLGLFIVAGLAGPGHESAILFTAFCGLIGSALWAQGMRRNPDLPRPYEYYGGLAGISLGAVLLPDSAGSVTMLLLAAYAVAAPCIQALARVAFGALSRETPRPTTVYAMFWHVFCAVVLGRMWIAHCDLHLIAGVFGIVNGLGRFVEEAYREDATSQLVFGLRRHQWTAAATVVAGGLVTALAQSAPAPVPEFTTSGFTVALAAAAVSTIALGVDFPESKWRFARLM